MWVPRSSKHKRSYNPTYIYYIAHIDAINKYKFNLQKETKQLTRKLKLVFSEEDAEDDNKPEYAVMIDKISGMIKKNNACIINKAEDSDNPLQQVKKEMDEGDSKVCEELESLKRIFKHTITVYESEEYD